MTLVPRPPKDRFTALDVRALAREVRALARPRIDKVFEFEPSGWTLALRPRTGGRVDLVLEPGRFGAVVAEGPEHPERPGSFAQQLRRQIAGTTIAEVPDPAGERELRLELVRGELGSVVTLIVELFGNGNLLLIAEGKILAVARARTWAHRSLRPGAEYRPPPGRPDPFVAEAPWIAERLAGSTTDRVSTLAARAGFGGPLAEELLARADFAPDAPASEDALAVAEAVRRAALALVAEVDSGPTGHLYWRGEEIVDVTPYPARRRQAEAGIREETGPTFGEATLTYFRSRPAPVPVAPTPVAGERPRLQRQRGQQQAAIDRLQAEAARLSAQGTRILERFAEAEAARASLDPEGPDVVEVELDGLRVPLDRDQRVDVSARRLFEEGKRISAKLEGARAALEETEAALRDATEEDAPRPAARPAPPPPRRLLWYERFRWFFSSESILVIAGRDAVSNDQLVKRHLGAADRYVHADLHGAASVVVKRSEGSGADPGPATLREAGQFAVAFSKAWRAGHASADAFWVRPDQVSKAAASGEYVARGAWVIHGTKQPLRDLPLELGLGTESVDGTDRWTVAPEAALRSRGTVRYLLTPGEERLRGAAEVELASTLGLSRTLLQSLLPAGGLSIRRA